MAYIQDWGMRVQAQPQINTTRRSFLHLSQNENGRMLNIRITDVNIPAGSTVVLAGTKPDGTVYSQAGTLSGNTATFAEDVQMTAVAGTWDAKITVTNGGNCICTARITITIDPDTVAGGAIPSDSQLDGIIAECRAIADSVRKEAYGSPLVADAVEDMTDQSRVYVYTGSESGMTAGHWYYYNGTAWTDGGVYNAVAVDTDTTLTIAGKAADAKEVGDQLASVKEDLEINFHINGNVKPNLVVGSLVNATNNSIGASSNFSMTAPIAVKKGQKVTLTATGYNTVIGMIATCNADNTERVTVVTSVDSNEHDYIYNVTEDGYIVCSFNHNHDHKIAISLDYYSLFGDVDALEICQVGTIEQLINKYIDKKYVDLNGNIQSNSNFFISQSINLYSGQTISVSTRGHNTAIISEYDADTDTYKPLVIDTDHAEHNYTYTANKSMTIRCTIQWYGGGQQLSYSASITTSHIVVGAVEDAVDNKTADPLANIQYPQMFANIICMGDSLTRGESGGSQSVQLATNYPFYFEKLTQADVTNQSRGGITAQGFWNTFASTYDYAPFDCAVIFLGTNGGLTDTVETDCDVDYTQNADTNTGCYGKIIGRIKATAPNCKIFCVAGVNDYIRRATTMNPAVRALAEFYNVGLIDVENCIMSDSGGSVTAERYLYRPIDGIHYNRLGYMTLANMIYDSMSDFMSKHLTMYDD